jgi:hypothetical protein
METPVAEPVVEAPAPVEPVAAAPSDPFTVDETRLASLSPEQRAALDPVFEEWKTRAKAEMEKSGKTYEEKYKPHMEKAQALDQLVKDPRFQTWWTNVTQVATNQNPQGAGAIQGSKPQDFATPQEWQEAVAEAYAGDGSKLQGIQQRMFAIMATPVITQLREGQEELKLTFQMKNLIESHADFKELDAIGRDPKDPKGESLMSMCLDWAEENGKTLEDAYTRARAMADAMKVGAQQQAMGLVQGKKESVTSGPSTNKAGSAVIEVADADELMQKNMEYLANGQTPPRFVIRPPAPKPSPWAQRT